MDVLSPIWTFFAPHIWYSIGATGFVISIMGVMDVILPWYPRRHLRKMG
jgi:hypothetical protein